MQLSEAEQKLLEDYNGQLERFIRDGYLGSFWHPTNSLNSESPIVKLVTLTQKIMSEFRVKDELTGLWNRKMMVGFLEQAIAKTRTESSIPVAVAYFDIDKMKYVNDMLGHIKGDEILQEIARITAAHLQPFHFVGRIGGDEFLAVLNVTTAEARGLLHKMQAEISALQYKVSETRIQTILKIVLTQLSRDDTVKSCLFRLEEKMHQIHHSLEPRNDIWIV